MHLLSGVLSAVRLKGIRIPQDLSLIASNDSQLAQLATPSISVIRYDAYALGREAAQLLLQQLATPQNPLLNVRVELPTELLIRESCSAPASAVNR